jgi:hypothetical protein
MEKLSYENILTNITLHQIDSTSLHLLFQRNYLIKCDKLSRFFLWYKFARYSPWFSIYKRCLDLSEKEPIAKIKTTRKMWTKMCQAKKKNMCDYGHPTHPIFQLPTLTFFIGNYSTLIFANDPINFYTEFG